MLNMILKYIPVLCVAIICNIGLGMYNNINLNSQSFNIKKLSTGIIKAVIIASSFIGLAYCFDMTGTIINIGAFELNPELIMTSTIALYVGKDTIALANILGIKKKMNDVSLIDNGNITSNSDQIDPLERK